MKITSTNIAKPTTFTWNGQQLTTGIYKTPTNEAIYLGKDGVKGDEVSDRNVHGGEFKACYLFSEDQYSYWENMYPHLNWDWGMFGENLTISGLDETTLAIGDIYKVGDAIIQVTQPREPCFKFAHKFGNQDVLKQFIDHGYPGTYVRVLKEGFVKKGDTFILLESAQNSLTIFEFFKLLFSPVKDKKLIERAIQNDSLPLKKRIKLQSFLD